MVVKTNRGIYEVTSVDIICEKTYEMYADIIDGNKEILTYLNELYAMDEEDSLCS